MTTIQQKAQVLEDYEEWRQERTLEGIDLSAGAYKEYLENEENQRIVVGLRGILNSLDTDSHEVRLARIAQLFTEPKEIPA